MSFEKRVLSSLNILVMIAIPAMLVIVHLPHREGITDYSVIYIVLGGMALMFLVGNLLNAYPNARGRIFENLPTFFLGTILYGFLISVAIYFSGGLESPFYYAALIGPLLAGVCFRLSLALISTTTTTTFYFIAILLGARLEAENTQLIAFNLVYLFLACLFSNRLSQEMLRHEQAKDEATNLSNFIRKLEKAKTEFVSVVSHELRTPLTSIQGFSEFLLSRDMTREKRREFYGIINNEAERLGRLITNLLNLSKIEAGIELNKETVDIISLLKEDIDLVQSQTDLHHISLSPGVKMPYIYADKDRVHQVVKNIFSNAIKYSPDGGEIEVDVGLDGKYAWFSVTDHGIGIPAEELPFIFERFRRVEKGEAATISGTGLGLAIVKHLVEMHGGRIVVRSELKAGSAFTVYLPVRGNEVDVEFKRNLVKMLSGLLWMTIPLFALLLLLPYELPGGGKIDYEPVFILLFFTLLLNIGVALLPMRRPFIVRYNNVLFFIIASLFSLVATLAILETGGVRSPLFPFLLLVACFGTTYYASQVTAILLMVGLSVSYTFFIVHFQSMSGYQRSEDLQLLAAQILFLFLTTYFINRLGLDSREQVRIKNEALRELKLLSEMDQATSNFVSAVSFEMRTPLTSIQGFSEMLLNQDLGEEKEREFIDIINKEAEHLTELVEELLDISRLESGKAKLKREEIDVYRFLRGNLRALETICKPEDLVMDIPEDLPALYLDRNRIDKVMSTIFNHIIRECEGGAEVRVSAKTAENSLVLTMNYRPVRERGRGLESETLEPLGFEPREEELDVAIARRIIMAHGGSMNVILAPGHWSTVVFRLPVMELEEYLAEERGFTA